MSRVGIQGKSIPDRAEWVQRARGRRKFGVQTARQLHGGVEEAAGAEGAEMEWGARWQKDPRKQRFPSRAAHWNHLESFQTLRESHSRVSGLNFNWYWVWLVVFQNL